MQPLSLVKTVLFVKKKLCKKSAELTLIYIDDSWKRLIIIVYV